MQFVGADHSETIQCSANARTGAEAYTADGFDKWFSFHGHPGGVAIGSDDTVWVSDSRSAAIWQIAPDGTCTPVIEPTMISRVGGPTPRHSHRQVSRWPPTARSMWLIRAVIVSVL